MSGVFRRDEAAPSRSIDILCNRRAHRCHLPARSSNAFSPTLSDRRRTSSSLELLHKLQLREHTAITLHNIRDPEKSLQANQLRASYQFMVWLPVINMSQSEYRCHYHKGSKSASHACNSAYTVQSSFCCLSSSIDGSLAVRSNISQRCISSLNSHDALMPSLANCAFISLIHFCSLSPAGRI